MYIAKLFNISIFTATEIYANSLGRQSITGVPQDKTVWILCVPQILSFSVRVNVVNITGNSKRKGGEKKWDICSM